jgi:hypothetical protein
MKLMGSCRETTACSAHTIRNSSTPDPTNRERLLRKYLDGIHLDVAISSVAERLAGLAPADIEAICKAAVRKAFGRSEPDTSIPRLVLALSGPFSALRSSLNLPVP